MTVQSVGREAIQITLAPLLRDAETHYGGTFRERAAFVLAQREIAQEIIDALHDRGLTIQPMEGPFEPSVTTKYIDRFKSELRLEVEVQPGIYWQTLQYDHQHLMMGSAESFREHLVRQTTRAIARKFEDKLLEATWPMVAQADLTPKEPADG